LLFLYRRPQYSSVVWAMSTEPCGEHVGLHHDVCNSKIRRKSSGGFRGGAETAPPRTLGDGLTPSLTIMLANAKFWSFFLKTLHGTHNIQNECHTSGFLAALECTKFVFSAGDPQGSRWGSLHHSPDPLPSIRGPASKREEKGRGRERKGPAPLSQIPGSAPVKHIIFGPWQGYRRCYGKQFVGGLRCYHSTITQYRIKAHFCFIHYVPVWPWPLTYFPKIWSRDWELVLNIASYLEIYIPLPFWNMRP